MSVLVQRSAAYRAARIVELEAEIEHLRAALEVSRGVIKFYAERGVIADENASQALALADAALSQ